MKNKFEKFKDDLWRLQTLYKIRNKTGKTIPFALNKPQLMLQASTSRNNFVIKARQKGISTYYGIKYLDRACFRRNYTAAIISHDRESIERIFRPIRFAYDRMPAQLKPEVDKGGGSKYSLYFPKINSRIYVSLEIVSEAITDLHVSEYALMKDKDRFSRSIDAVPLNGQISIETTPRGMNHAYTDWRDPDFPFQKHLFPWFIDEEYQLECAHEITHTDEEMELIAKSKKLFGVDLTNNQINWRREKIKMKGRESFFEEFLEDDISCFLTSGESVLDLFYVKHLLDNYCPPIEKIDGISIYEKHDNKERFVAAADTAGGDGGDFNVCKIYRVRDFAECASFRLNKIRPKEFADKIAQMCALYRNPILAVERNNHGHAVLLALSEINRYPNLYKHDDDKLGWNTNTLTRQIAMDTFVEAFESRQLKPRDHAFMKECLTLVNNNGKIEAAENEHDDEIMTTAIAIQMIIKEKPKEIYNNANQYFLV